MKISEIFRDDSINLYSKDEDVFIEILKTGFSLERLNNVLSLHHEIELEGFSVLKNAITAPINTEVKIGKYKERILIEVSSDLMRAYVKYFVSTKDLLPANRANLGRETMVKIKQKGVVYGLKLEFLNGDLVPNKSYLCAEGVKPIDGSDSIIKMYNVDQDKPLVKSEARIDYYELMLIKKVNAGEWLGERIDASNGVPGQNVLGELIPQKPGKNVNLYYDKMTVDETKNGNITYLTAKINGAVKYIDGKISVQKHLEIIGDVDFGTGNIRFDGYVTIKGHVADGFTVEATNDIQIEGPLGVGNARSIISNQGSIYIKGGIVSKTNTLVKAANNIFLKFAENCSITCNGILNIGFYAISCILSAQEILVEASSGHIIGGVATAKIKIAVPILGNDSYRRTIATVHGFNRQQMVEEQDRVTQKLNFIKDETQRAKNLIAQISGQGQMNPELHQQAEQMIFSLTSMKEQMKQLEDTKKTISEYLKAKGDWELNITKMVFPNCQLSISQYLFEITEIRMALRYYLSDGQVKEAQ